MTTLYIKIIPSIFNTKGNELYFVFINQYLDSRYDGYKIPEGLLTAEEVGQLMGGN